jgi:SpoVK/Ycf46/Vps4 family AAA+-type ATPase
LEIVDKNEILQKISAEAHGFSGSELNNILQLAVLEASNVNKEGAINEGKVVLQREHLLNAMNKIQPLSLVELNTDVSFIILIVSVLIINVRSSRKYHLKILEDLDP